MKSFLPPILALLGLLAFSVWNCQAITAHTTRWAGQIEEASTLAQEKDWPAVQEAISESYQDWSRSQAYLHIVEKHDAVDDAEAMYRRLAAFAEEEEPSEFQAEAADLIDQLHLLAEQERFTVENVL